MQDIRDCFKYAEKIYEYKNGSDFFYSDRETDLDVGIYLFPNKIIVSFRGTESITDGFYDLRVKKTKMQCGSEIHTGFFRQLFCSKVYDKFLEKVIELAQQADYIYITGHSLGGALATLFGYHFSRYTYKHVNIISFASPRVGNYKWYKNFNKRINLSHLRVYISSDPVPLFPIINYFHTGERIKLKTGHHLYKVNDHKTNTYREFLN